jgi:hypothetical protein
MAEKSLVALLIAIQFVCAQYSYADNTDAILCGAKCGVDASSCSLRCNQILISNPRNATSYNQCSQQCQDWNNSCSDRCTNIERNARRRARDNPNNEN